MGVRMRLTQRDGVIEDYLENAGHNMSKKTLEQIGKEMLPRFVEVTPDKEVAKNWSYEVISKNHNLYLIFNNSTIQNGRNIAVVIDSGHAMPDGRWIEGAHYLEKPVKETCQRIIEET